MSKTDDTLQRLQEFFDQNQALDLWLLEFGATHQRGRLRIVKRGVSEWVELVFDGCTYFCGAPLGGPYTLRVAVHRGQQPQTEQVEIMSTNEDFLIRCSHVRVDKVYGRYCEEFFGQSK
jgi:hypothetical protein